MDSQVTNLNSSVWIGYDAREADAVTVAVHSIQRTRSVAVPVRLIVLEELRSRQLYYRPTSIRNSNYWDEISEAPMSTQFAISRFLTPILAREQQAHGWALFMDCDMLVRRDIVQAFAYAMEVSSMADKAVLCVKHDYQPEESIKMDNQVQVLYRRKNWSSVMMFNLDHPSNRNLTVGMINSVPGRDLHRFCWLQDNEIGELGVNWNFLVGHYSRSDYPNPNIVHFTSGGPWLPDYSDVDFGDEWSEELAMFHLETPVQGIPVLPSR